MKWSGDGAMPVPLAGRRPDRVAGTDLENLAAASLDAADALGHVQRLADGMRVPPVAGTGREPDDVDADARGLLARRDHVVPGITGESFGRRLHGRLLRLDVHLLVLPALSWKPAARARPTGARRCAVSAAGAGPCLAPRSG